MWKLMVFGIVVQLVLLISVLDVVVYEDKGIVEDSRILDKPCSPNLMVITIEGLQYDDVLWVLNKSAAAKDLKQVAATYVISGVQNCSRLRTSTNYTCKMANVSGSDNCTSNWINDSIPVNSVFDGRHVLYVGPPAAPYLVNTSLWDFIMTNPESNRLNLSHSQNNDYKVSNDSFIERLRIYGSYLANRHKTIDHMRQIVDNQRLNHYPVKFINIGRSSASEQIMPRRVRIWYFTEILELIANVTRSSRYVFAIASSMSLLIQNGDHCHNEVLLLYGESDCVIKKQSPITYEEAYSMLKGYNYFPVTRKTTPYPTTNVLRMEGNILELLENRAFDLQRFYMSFGVYFTGWETLSAIFNSLDVLDIDIHPLVLTTTTVIFLMWIGFLSFMAIQLAVDSSHSVEEFNPALKKLLNAVCLALVLGFCIAAKCCGCPCRYLIYISVAVLVSRMFCGGLIPLAALQMSFSVADKVKIGLQAAMLVCVVECLFWSILYPKALFVVFLLAGFARMIQGSLTVMRFITIIAYSLAMLFIGVQYLWSFSIFGKLLNLNLSAAFWAVAGIGAIKFLMDKSNHDRFLLFVCIVDLLTALTFANVFLIQGFSSYTVVPVVGFFMCVSLILPLFGGTDPKNRLLELAVATAAMFVFFACNGESFFLLSSFTACFCSYMMDRANTKSNDDGDTYINILPATFHTVLLLLACHVTTPHGGEAILRAYTVFSSEAHYQVIASGIFFLLKLGFLVHLLEATFLSSGKKLLAVPNLFMVVAILNLISFRAYIQYSIFSYEGGRRAVFINHILLHILAAMSFYLYSFVQVLCNSNLLAICKTSRTTYIPQEVVH